MRCNTNTLYTTFVFPSFLPFWAPVYHGALEEFYSKLISVSNNILLITDCHHHPVIWYPTAPVLRWWMYWASCWSLISNLGTVKFPAAGSRSCPSFPQTTRKLFSGWLSDQLNGSKTNKHKNENTEDFSPIIFRSMQNYIESHTVVCKRLCCSSGFTGI
jgi:hypothetical protein